MIYWFLKSRDFFCPNKFFQDTETNAKQVLSQWTYICTKPYSYTYICHYFLHKAIQLHINMPLLPYSTHTPVPYMKEIIWPVQSLLRNGRIIRLRLGNLLYCCFDVLLYCCFDILLFPRCHCNRPDYFLHMQHETASFLKQLHMPLSNSSCISHIHWWISMDGSLHCDICIKYILFWVITQLLEGTKMHFLGCSCDISLYACCIATHQIVIYYSLFSIV